MRDHGGSEWALLQLANTAPRPSRSGTRPPPQRDRSWCLSVSGSCGGRGRSRGRSRGHVAVTGRVPFPAAALRHVTV
jgi:hypothetical protein